MHAYICPKLLSRNNSQTSYSRGTFEGKPSLLIEAPAAKLFHPP